MQAVKVHPGPGTAVTLIGGSRATAVFSFDASCQVWAYQLVAAQLNEVLMMENSRNFIPMQENTVITSVPLVLHFLLDLRSQVTSYGKPECSSLLQLINWESWLEKAGVTGHNISVSEVAALLAN